MCGRYRLSRRKEMLAEYFDVDFDDLDWQPRYNIAPTQPVPVVRVDQRRLKASLLRWGLIPAWASDPNVGAGMINARAESAANKPAFCDALRRQRCLIPADGFYEWKGNGRERQPYCFEVSEGEMFAFAGIWDRWSDRSGNPVESCSILTTVANAVTSTVHDRMPVIVRRESYGFWLEPGAKTLDALLELLRPYDAGPMRCFPVSTRINQVANDDEECCRGVAVEEIQANLFS